MLKTRNLEAGYGELRVLKGLSLHVTPGEIVAIIGANGAGKSTLLGSLAGLVRPSAGSVILRGADVTGERPERILAAGCSLLPEGRKLRFVHSGLRPVRAEVRTAIRLAAGIYADVLALLPPETHPPAA